MKKKIIGTLVVIAIIGVMYGIYQAKRSINYSLGYEKEVTETVCAMIKPEKRAEILVNPKDCE